MKAVQFNAYGGVEQIKVTNDTSKPSAKKDQVLVETQAASINPVDYKLRNGMLKEYVPLIFPCIIGGDFSGVISEVGEGVIDFQVGDEVYGQGGVLNGGSGAFAEFVVAGIEKVAKKPSNIDFDQAAAMPLVGISAIQALEDHIHLQQGQKILIHGGAGGIGSVAIQIAKALGAFVATTVNFNDIEFAISLGADQVVDYKSEKFEEKLKDFDSVFDTVGGETLTKSFIVVKNGGVIVSMNGKPDETLGKEKNITAIGQMTDATPARFAKLSEYLQSGKVKPIIDKTFPIDEAKEAFSHLEEESPRGKVVLNI